MYKTIYYEAPVDALMDVRFDCTTAVQYMCNTHTAPLQIYYIFTNPKYYITNTSAQTYIKTHTERVDSMFRVYGTKTNIHKSTTKNKER